jgi:hypothetical protein
MIEQQICPAILESMCLFSSRFYLAFTGNMSTRGEDNRYFSARRFIHWDIFEKKFLVMPINDVTQ